MATYQFPGFLAFLQTAAAQLGCPGAAGPARRIAALAAMANLCAQAVEAEAEHAPKILARAEEFRDELLAAYRAAELMLDEVRSALNPAGAPAGGLPADSPPVRPESQPAGEPLHPARPPRDRGSR